MFGPPLSTIEIAALLLRGVERLEALGVTHDRAVEAVAAEHGVATERVADLLSTHGHTSREKTAVLA